MQYTYIIYLHVWPHVYFILYRCTYYYYLYTCTGTLYRVSFFYRYVRENILAGDDPHLC